VTSLACLLRSPRVHDTPSRDFQAPAILALCILLLLAALSLTGVLFAVDHRRRLRRIEAKQVRHGKALERFGQDHGSCVLLNITKGPREHDSDADSA
jgi:hypothetical protein